MRTDEYLRRIGLEPGKSEPSAEYLRILQRRHLLSVPFENLDIHWKRPIVLDEERFFEKIVGARRGGFCYELNGLFRRLLVALGFECRLVSARVSQPGGKFGAEYDHLAIIASAGGEEFLVDVGFGAFTAEPLRFVVDTEQRDDNGTFSIRKFDDEYFEVAKKAGENWQSEYIFKDLSRALSEFAGMCEYHQTSPESHFTRGRVCSLMTDGGRKTLTDRKFIETRGGQKTETDIATEAEFEAALAREFSIETDASCRVNVVNLH